LKIKTIFKQASCLDLFVSYIVYIIYIYIALLKADTKIMSFQWVYQYRTSFWNYLSAGFLLLFFQPFSPIYIYVLYTRVIRLTYMVYDRTADSWSVFSKTILKNENGLVVVVNLYIYTHIIYFVYRNTSIFNGLKARRTEQSIQVVMIAINFTCFGRGENLEGKCYYYKVAANIR